VIDPLAGSTNIGNTGHAAIISAYCGMLTDPITNTIAFLHNGGHLDYYGNEVYLCDLLAEDPVFVRDRDSSVHDGSDTVPVYGDGNPGADHTAFTHVVTGDGQWVNAGMGGTVYVGNSRYDQWWKYSRSSHAYTNLGNGYQDRPGTAIGAAVYDAVNDEIIACLGGNVGPSIEYVNGTTLVPTGTLNNNAIPNGGGITVALDTTNRILLLMDGNSGGGLSFYFMNLGVSRTGAWNSITATGPPVDPAWKFFWHPPSGKFLTWDGAQGIRTLTPTLGGNGYTALVWSTVAGAGGVTVPGTSVLMYDKVNGMPMPDGSWAMVVVPRYHVDMVYVMRITGAV